MITVLASWAVSLWRTGSYSVSHPRQHFGAHPERDSPSLNEAADDNGRSRVRTVPVPAMLPEGWHTSSLGNGTWWIVPNDE